MLVDLTMPLGPLTPVYPGDPSVEVLPASVLERDGCVDVALRLGNHSGTHLDAPAHMIAGGRTLDGFDPESFCGPGKLVDLTAGEPDLSHIRGGDIVLLRTGLSDRYTDPGYFSLDAGVSVQLASALADAGAKLVGIDAGSVDTGTPYDVHLALLSRGVLIAENLIGLHQLEGRQFEVIALPLRMDLDGAPCRVVARV